MKRYTDVPGLAAHLHVAEATVRAWVRLLNVPVVRIGRLVPFDLDAVEVWVESGGPSGLAAAMRADVERRRVKVGERPAEHLRGKRSRRKGAIVAARRR